jgi:hypothetical protein
MSYAIVAFNQKNKHCREVPEMVVPMPSLAQARVVVEEARAADKVHAFKFHVLRCSDSDSLFKYIETSQ